MSKKKFTKSKSLKKSVVTTSNTKHEEDKMSVFTNPPPKTQSESKVLKKSIKDISNPSKEEKIENENKVGKESHQLQSNLNVNIYSSKNRERCVLESAEIIEKDDFIELETFDDRTVGVNPLCQIENEKEELEEMIDYKLMNIHGLVSYTKRKPLEVVEKLAISLVELIHYFSFEKHKKQLNKSQLKNLIESYHEIKTIDSLANELAVSAIFALFYLRYYIFYLIFLLYFLLFLL